MARRPLLPRTWPAASALRGEPAADEELSILLRAGLDAPHPGLSARLIAAASRPDVAPSPPAAPDPHDRRAG